MSISTGEFRHSDPLAYGNDYFGDSAIERRFLRARSGIQMREFSPPGAPVHIPPAWPLARLSPACPRVGLRERSSEGGRSSADSCGRGRPLRHSLAGAGLHAQALRSGNGVERGDRLQVDTDTGGVVLTPGWPVCLAWWGPSYESQTDLDKILLAVSSFVSERWAPQCLPRVRASAVLGPRWLPSSATRQI